MEIAVQYVTARTKTLVGIVELDLMLGSGEQLING